MQQLRAPVTTKRELDQRVGIKLKVISDGTPSGLSVVDSASGAQLWGVESVIIQIQRDKPPAAIIRMANVEVDATAIVDVVQEGLNGG